MNPLRIKKPAPYIHHYRDRHGRERIYFNKPGRARVALPGPLYGETFWTAYHEAAAGEGPAPSIGAERTVPGTISDLLVRYYGSPDFIGLADSSRTVYRRQLEAFRAEHGTKTARNIERGHVRAILGKMADRPNAANNLLKRLKVLMGFALDIGMVRIDPTVAMKGFKIKSEGFHTWSEAEIARYEKKHEIGSKPRLAMALMLYTGQRRSDAVRMGWQHVKDGLITVRQQKTGASLDIPIHAELRRVLDQAPKDNLTFLLTGRGQPFTSNGFGNWMREQCDAAKLPDCSSHGLRKAMATRLAEAGCSNQQIKSITGHTTDKEVTRYTKAAQQRVMATSAMLLIASAATEQGTEVANPNPEVSKNGG